MVELFPELIGVVIALLTAYCCFKSHESKSSPFKASVYCFILTIVFILAMLRPSIVEAEMIFFGAFACHFILVGVVHLITNDCEKYEKDTKIWINSMTLLMVGTGVLLLLMNYPNTKSVLHPLAIGFTGGFFGVMLDPRRKKEVKEENL